MDLKVVLLEPREIGLAIKIFFGQVVAEPQGSIASQKPGLVATRTVSMGGHGPAATAPALYFERNGKCDASGAMALGGVPGHILSDLGIGAITERVLSRREMQGWLRYNSS